jgi:uncharacterized damage-inducible protein DinB
MNLSELLLPELKKEAISTEKLLMIVPDGKYDWKPHDKSFPLGRLATHVAELPRWLNYILESDELDMIATPLERHICADNKELMEFYSVLKTNGFTALEKATNEQLMAPWTFRAGERIITQSSRYDAIRGWMCNHQYHHRGQLSVYLRLLDIPIPGMYGPSADDRIKMQAAQK